MTELLAGACAGAAAALAVTPRPRVTGPSGSSRATGPPARPAPAPWRRVALACLAGVGVALFLGGPVAWPTGAGAALVAWWLLAHAEPRGARREREAVARDLPHLVRLLTAALRSGAAPGDAVALACAALPGPAADRLRDVPHRLGLGVAPATVWAEVAADGTLAAVGRALARAHESGAPVVAAVQRLADDLEHQARSDVEDRARSVGVRAALPLGLCLLPSFLLLGIVPLVAGLLATVAP